MRSSGSPARRRTPSPRSSAPPRIAERIAERFADLTREVPGLSAGQVEVRPGSPFADRALGDTRARTRTGASIVAVVRGEDVIASPDRARPCGPGTSWW
ncbi:TrkA C-terminal domain-containing protein [Streptomyces sp. D2-8]|uniref:cation:proton antiporter regulatory subunit n=1 Tax=Streptomyces sp. D2-8 TaxID=2707767 RepID=UPI0020BDD8F4